MAKTSPFDAVHRQLGARFEEIDGWTLPADFGDKHVEVSAIREHCAVVDLSSFGRLNLKGVTDRHELESLFSQRSGPFFDGRWEWAQAKTEGQGILCRIARFDGEYAVLTPSGKTQTIIDLLQTRFSGVVDVTDKTAMLGLYGPSAYESMRAVLPFSIDDLEPQTVTRMSFFMIPFRLLRGSWLGAEGIELICPSTAGPLAAGAVAKYRHKYNIIPAGMDSLTEAMASMDVPL